MICLINKLTEYNIKTKLQHNIVINRIMISLNLLKICHVVHNMTREFKGLIINLPDTFVHNNSYCMLGYIVNSSGLSMVRFVWHTLLYSTTTLQKENIYD